MSMTTVLGRLFAFVAAATFLATGVTDPGAGLVAPAAAPATRDRPRLAREDCVTSECHAKFKDLKVAHKPMKDGTCEACHEATDEKNHKFKLTGEEPSLCTQCHEKVLDGLAFVHGPVAAGSCTACHDPHGSNHDKCLTKGPVGTCLECHEGLDGNGKSKSRHKPIADDCSFCHAAHGGADKMLTKMQGPTLCLECHEDFKDGLAKAKVPHAAVTDGRACLACHDPHAAPHEKLVRKPSKELCLQCHDREIDGKHGKIQGIGARLKENSVHHGPIKQDDCITCHKDVHGGSHSDLLMGSYPEKFYVAFDEKAYGLCFECHDAAMVTEATTTAATGFRNGDRNLHAVHVGNPTKGRACRVCHDTHASTLPFLLRDKVGFGPNAWPLPIGYQKAKEGGSCASGCHRPYAYDRTTPVANLKPASPPPATPPPAPNK